MQPRSLILITIDCLRADHIGFLGYGRPTTPFLDSLLEESVIFSNAIAAGTPTYYAVPALLASRHPLSLGRDVLGLAPDESTLAAVLAECGFTTAAFSAGNPYISPQFGYERGFEVFRDFLQQDYVPLETRAEPRLRQRANEALSRACHRVPRVGAAYDELYFRYCQRASERDPKSLDELRRYPAANVIVDCAISWLQQHSGQRFFAWLHLMDPHAPYYPPAAALEKMGDSAIDAAEARYLNSFWARGDLGCDRLIEKRDGVVKLYDAGIRWVDEQIGRLASALVDLNIWDKCAVAITADHGEEFLDHGGRFHTPFKLTEEMVHVPLQMRVPGIKHQVIESPLSTIDIAPTLLDILDVPIPADFRGRSWWNLRSGSRSCRPVITETVRGCTNPFHRENRLGSRLLAIRKDQFKLAIDFSSASEKLFDLSSDPREARPLALHAGGGIRKELLQYARRHLAESHQSRDFDRRQALQVRDLRLELAHSATRN